MTCRELHSRIEDVSWASTLSKGDEVAEHTAHCAACRSFVEEQQRLRNATRLVRESAGSVPDSVDAAVLSAYRRQWAEHGRRELTVARMPRPVIRLGWVLAAAVVLVTVGLFFIPRKRNPTAAKAATTITSPIASLEPQKVLTPVVAQATRPKPLSTRKEHHAAASPVRASATAAPAANFRSLMYCDALICTQEMDVIRVQLPVASIGRPVDFVPAGGMVNADVLIGPDGVARGIRIEQ